MLSRAGWELGNHTHHLGSLHIIRAKYENVSSEVLMRWKLEPSSWITAVNNRKAIGFLLFDGEKPIICTSVYVFVIYFFFYNVARIRLCCRRFWLDFTPWPPSTSQWSWVLLYCTETVATSGKWKKCLRFCVATWWISNCYPVALIAPQCTWLSHVVQPLQVLGQLNSFEILDPLQNDIPGCEVP